VRFTGEDDPMAQPPEPGRQEIAGPPPVPGSPTAVGYRKVSAEETVRGNRTWWDREAGNYLAEHGDFLGEDGFTWCPEGLREDDARLLGPPETLTGLRVLEVGCGAAQCTRWLRRHGARAIGLDLSRTMLGYARRADPPTPALCADARALPLPDGGVDLAFSAYGAVPFVADPWTVMAEVFRVLRPGGRWVFAVTHPVRWAFPDDPGPGGLTATRSYFDRTPYVESDATGQVLYAEHHRTLGDRIRDLTTAGFVLDGLVEPEWPDGHDRSWGGWSRLRGERLPGTAIFLTHRPG
jgi:SAM-dependent methyltransferase